MLELAIELERPVFSVVASVVHIEFEFKDGDSGWTEHLEG